MKSSLAKNGQLTLIEQKGNSRELGHTLFPTRKHCLSNAALIRKKRSACVLPKTHRRFVHQAIMRIAMTSCLATGGGCAPFA